MHFGLSFFCYVPLKLTDVYNHYSKEYSKHQHVRTVIWAYENFNWLVKHGSEKGVSFLQKTHSTSEIENAWSNRVRGELIMSHGTSKSRGTAVLYDNEATS